MRSRIVVLDAPSNLGLRPPADGTVPGCYKLPWALREAGLLPRLGGSDGGAVVPGRYDRGGWKPGDGVFNAGALASFTGRLANRVGRYVAAGEFLVVLGGDCSILLGAALGLRRLGRYGLAFIDGHSDFRHAPDLVGAAAGEDLALATGRGQGDLVDIEGLRPYVRDADTVVFGIRDGDEATDELAELRIETWPAAGIRQAGAYAAATQALARLEAARLDGFWVHLDADVLDPSVMPAVDSPEPGGLAPDELTVLLTALLASPYCVGIEVTVLDPDLDPDGRHAALLADILVGAVLRLPLTELR
jgi:arginase